MDGEIDNEALAEALDDEAARVVDIRPPRAFRQGHLPDSENVPLGRLVDSVERFEGDERVVTVCPHGKSSVKAARLIAAYEGFDGRVESYGPGLTSWDGEVARGAAADGGTGSGDAEDTDGRADEGPDAPF